MYNRRHVRISCELIAKVKYDDMIMDAKIDDLSAGGCRLYGEDELYINLKRNDIVNVEFSYNNIQYSLQAKVIRDMLSPRPVSVQFLSTDKDLIKSLDKLIIRDFLDK